MRRAKQVKLRKNPGFQGRILGDRFVDKIRILCGVLRVARTANAIEGSLGLGRRQSAGTPECTGQLGDPIHAGFKYGGFCIIENHDIAADGALESDLLPHCPCADDQNFPNVINLHSHSPLALNFLSFHC